MDDSRKKPIMIGFIVVCLVAAALITLKTRPKRYGIESVRGQMMWMLCKACKAEYEMDKADYYTEAAKNPSATRAPSLICEKCGAEKASKAIKCPNEECGKLFYRNNFTEDLADRCPYCKYSQTEERVKEIRGR